MKAGELGPQQPLLSLDFPRSRGRYAEKARLLSSGIRKTTDSANTLLVSPSPELGETLLK